MSANHVHAEQAAAPAKVQRKAAVHTGHAHPILNLQRQVGNSVVSQMIAQRSAIQRESEGPEGEEEELQMKPDLSAQREEEDELQMKPDLSIQREEEEELQMKPDLSVQRESDGEEEELQMKADLSVQREEEDELAA